MKVNKTIIIITTTEEHKIVKTEPEAEVLVKKEQISEGL